MSATLLRLNNPLAVALHKPDRDELHLVTLANGPKLFVLERTLGGMLGYVDPVAALSELYTQHEAELRWRSVCIELFDQHLFGCATARVFDLEGAMRVCELARTPSAVLVYSWLAGEAVAAFTQSVAPIPSAVVLPFPKRRKARAVQRSARS